jgi:serine protease Do
MISHRILRIAGVLLVAAGCLVLSFPSLAQAPDKDKRSEFNKDSPKVMALFKDVVSKPSQSTVRITCDGKEAALGTIVGAEGWILTKASEVKGKIICRLKDGRELAGRIVGVHPKHDLALLQVEAKGLTPIDWIESKKAPVGNWLASPGLGELPVAIGVVSVATRDVPQPKNPLPTPSPTSGYLGVALNPDETGPKVGQVLPDSGAAKAGLKVNDVILSVSGKAVDNVEAFLKALQAYKPGDVVKLKLKRGEMEVEVEAKLGKRPQGRGDFQNSLGSELSNRRDGFPTILQHDTVIRARDCGGPVVDLDGKAIGINIARAGRTESYTIPSEVILPLLPELMSGKLAPPKEPTVIEKLALAKTALEKAEAERLAAEKKVAEARAAIERAEKDKAAADKKLADAKAALEKAEKDAQAQPKDEK